MANEQLIESTAQSKEDGPVEAGKHAVWKEAKAAEKQVWKYQQKQKLKETLTPMQFHITQEKGTER